MSRLASRAFACAPLWVRGLVAASFLVALSPAIADDGNIVLIEENWELVIGDADAETVAPQITCTIAPRGSLNGKYGTFEINHASVPSFSAGGLNLHMWQGNFRLQSRNFPSVARLQKSGEVIRWKLVMALSQNKLFIGVNEGHSDTWGDFGFNDLLCVAETSLSTLRQYSPDDSVANSGVGYASNRVESLKIKSVRMVSDSGAETVDGTVRTVFARASN